MTDTPGKSNEEALASLRRRAELLLDRQGGDADLSLDDMRRLVHDFRVQQIELQIQNEELRRAQQAEQESRMMFHDLFHDAPVGYAVIDEAGIMRQVNQTLATMLGTRTDLLRDKPFSDCIVASDRHIFLARYRALFKHPQKKQIHCRLRTAEEKATHVVVSARAGNPTGDGDPRLLLTVTDVTEMRRAQTKLEDSERRYRLAQELSGLGTWEWNVATGEIHWSDEILALWGYDDESFRGTFEEVAERVHPNDRAAWQENVRACLEDGEEHRTEFRVTLPDGSIRWVSVFGDAERDKQGNALRMMGVVLDITDKKEAEEAIKRREELLNDTGEMARVGGWEIDLESEQVYWTKTTKIIHEVPDDFVPSLSEALDFFPEARSTVSRAVERLRRDGTPYDLEIPFLTARGRRLWTRAMGKAEFKDGECVRLYGTFQDITEAKRASDRVHAAKSFLDTVVDMSPFAMWISDPEGTVIRTNRALRHTLELSDDQIVGKYCVLEDENLERCGVMPLVQAVYASFKPARFSIPWDPAQAGEVDFSGGRGLFIDVSMFPILDNNGSLEHVVCQWVDITDLKRIEDELRELTLTLERRVGERTRELAAANRELESFAYSVSHDLRAPLRAISGFAQIIATRHQSDLNSQGQHYFDNIVEAADRMGRLIDDLLRYSRMGRRGVTLSRIDLGKTLDRVIETLAPEIEASGATVHVADDLPMVMANDTLLEQIFVNLLDNALKYTEPGRAPEIRICSRDQNGHVVIDVADNGTGIDPRYHEKVFRVFQRLHSEETSSGTGIGLALVAKAVTLLNGRISLDAQAGRGCTFHVALKPADISIEED